MAKKQTGFDNKKLWIVAFILAALIGLLYFATKVQFYKASADFSLQTLTGQLALAGQVTCANQNQIKLAPYVIYPDNNNVACTGVYALDSVATPLLGQKVVASGYYGNVKRYLDLSTTQYHGGFYFYAVSMVAYTGMTPNPRPTIQPTFTPRPLGTPIPAPIGTPSGCYCPGTNYIACPKADAVYCPMVAQ